MEYLRSEVGKMIDLPDRRIKFYTDQNTIYGFSSKTGKGYERKYTRKDVFMLAFVKYLAKSGFSMLNLKTIISLMNQYTDWTFDVNRYENNKFMPISIVTLGDNIGVSSYLQHDELDISGILNKNSVFTVVNLRQIYDSIKWID